MEFELELEWENIHLVGLCITAIFIIMADHDGFQYMRGKKQTLDLRRVRRLHYTVLAGLIMMIVSGGFLFADVWGEVIEEPAFYVKMLMVAALVANSFVIGSMMHIATQKPFNTLTKGEKSKLLISGAVSGLCWVGAACIGLFIL